MKEIMKGYPMTYQEDSLFLNMEKQVGEPCLNPDEVKKQLKRFIANVEKYEYYLYRTKNEYSGTRPLLEDVAVFENVDWATAEHSRWRIYVGINSKGIVVIDVNLGGAFNESLKSMNHVIRNKNHPLSRDAVKALKLHERIGLPDAANLLAHAACKIVGADRYEDLLCYSLARLKVPADWK